jgi:hypothetical protein
MIQQSKTQNQQQGIRKLWLMVWLFATHNDASSICSSEGIKIFPYCTSFILSVDTKPTDARGHEIPCLFTEITT